MISYPTAEDALYTWIDAVAIDLLLQGEDGEPLDLDAMQREAERLAEEYEAEAPSARTSHPFRAAMWLSGADEPTAHDGVALILDLAMDAEERLTAA